MVWTTKIAQERLTQSIPFHFKFLSISRFICSWCPSILPLWKCGPFDPPCVKVWPLRSSLCKGVALLILPVRRCGPFDPPCVKVWPLWSFLYKDMAPSILPVWRRGLWGSTASEDIKSSKGGVDFDHDWAAGYEKPDPSYWEEKGSGYVPISGLMITDTEHNPVKIDVRTNLPITDQYVMCFFHRSCVLICPHGMQLFTGNEWSVVPRIWSLLTCSLFPSTYAKHPGVIQHSTVICCIQSTIPWHRLQSYIRTTGMWARVQTWYPSQFNFSGMGINFSPDCMHMVIASKPSPSHRRRIKLFPRHPICNQLIWLVTPAWGQL